MYLCCFLVSTCWFLFNGSLQFGCRWSSGLGPINLWLFSLVFLWFWFGVLRFTRLNYLTDQPHHFVMGLCGLWQLHYTLVQTRTDGATVSLTGEGNTIAVLTGGIFPTLCSQSYSGMYIIYTVFVNVLKAHTTMIQGGIYITNDSISLSTFGEWAIVGTCYVSLSHAGR